MTLSTLAQPPVAAEPLFVHRCLSLGFPAWHCDGAGVIVGVPAEPAALRPWFDSTPLRRRVELAATALLTQLGAAAELFPGCWIIPFPHMQGSRCRYITLVMVLAQSAPEAREFHDLCTEAGLDPHAVGHALRPLLKLGMPDLDLIATTLRWSCDDLAQAQRQKITLDEFSNKLLQSYEEVNLLFRLSRFMNCVSDPERVMQMVCRQLQEVLPFQWVAIAFNKSGYELPELSGRLTLAGESPCPTAALEEQARILITRWSSDDWTRLLYPNTNALAAMVGSEVVCDPITHDGRVIGILLAGNKTGPDNEVSSLETQIIDASADFLGVFHENLCRFSEQQAFFMGTLQALTASIDAKDRYTCGHSERVALLTSRLAAALGMPKKEVEQFRIAGMVHDVGKIGVPEAVLCKAGRLTPDEFDLIKKHPRIGFEILKDIPLLADVLPGVLYHHERFDGEGYPERIGGQNIPLIARALALADTFDAMSSNRSYRPALSRLAVLTEIQRCSGTQFDPALVPTFLALDFAPYDAMVARQSQANAAA